VSATAPVLKNVPEHWAPGTNGVQERDVASYLKCQQQDAGVKADDPIRTIAIYPLVFCITNLGVPEPNDGHLLAQAGDAAVQRGFVLRGRLGFNYARKIWVRRHIDALADPLILLFSVWSFLPQCTVSRRTPKLLSEGGEKHKEATFCRRIFASSKLDPSYRVPYGPLDGALGSVSG
jgi:hypothetical protein